MKYIIFIILLLPVYSFAAPILQPLLDSAKICLAKHPKEESVLEELVAKDQVEFGRDVDLQKILASIEDYLANQNAQAKYIYIGDSLPAPMCLMGLPAPSKDGCNWKLYRRVTMNNFAKKKTSLVFSSLSSKDGRINSPYGKQCAEQLVKSKKVILLASGTGAGNYGEFYVFTMTGKELLLSVTTSKGKYKMLITDKLEDIKIFNNNIQKLPREVP